MSDLDALVSGNIWWEPEVSIKASADLAHLREGAELLKLSEWSFRDDPEPYCWYCEHYKRQGHAPNCKLDAWLKEQK